MSEALRERDAFEAFMKSEMERKYGNRFGAPEEPSDLPWRVWQARAAIAARPAEAVAISISDTGKASASVADVLAHPNAQKALRDVAEVRRLTEAEAVPDSNVKGLPSGSAVFPDSQVIQPATSKPLKAVRDFLFSEYNKDATTPAKIARQRRIGALLDSMDRMLK